MPKKQNMPEKQNAVVLLSGGLDSTTCLAMAKNLGFDLYALSFNYGQRHVSELAAAQRAARQFGAMDHLILDLGLDKIGGSALTDQMDVPKASREKTDEIPITYVPARNTVFLSYALAWAETLESSDIFIGVNAIDYSGYPDCRPEYIAAFEKMANLATKSGMEGKTTVLIRTPLIQMTNDHLIQPHALLLE